MKRLKYMLVVMLLVTSLVVYAAVTTGSTLAVLIDHTLSLVNTFVPDKVTADTDIDINIQKKVVSSGVNVLNAGGFTFELTDLQTNKTLTVVSDANGKAGFNLSYDEADIGKTYQYTLKEKNDARQGFTYSTQVYEITVSVQLKGNELIAALNVDGQPVDSLTAEFINIFTSEDGSQPPPPAGDHETPLVYGAFVLLSLVGIYLLHCRHKKHS